MAKLDDDVARPECGAEVAAHTSSLGMRFLILDGLRFAFALIVAIGHITSNIEQSYLAVDFFFILSGFVLTWAYYNRAHEPGLFRTFVIDRVARLYPLHLATLIFLIVAHLCYWLVTGKFNPADPAHYFGFALNLTLLQAFGPALELLKAIGIASDQLNPWNGPAWSVSVEFYGNLLLAAALLAFAATRVRAVFLAVLVAVGSYGLLSTTCLNLSCEDFVTHSAFSPLVHGLGCRYLRGLGGMALGMLCCGLVRRLQHSPRALAASAPAALCSGAALFTLVLLDGPIYGDLASIVTACVLISSIALYEHRRPLLSAPRLSKALLVAGALSYAVYMIHTPLIVLANLTFPGWNEQGLFSATCFILLVFAVAFPVHYLFELPMKRAVRKWFSQDSVVIGAWIRRRPV